MKKNSGYIFFWAVACLLFSCQAERKSAAYYNKNRTSIELMRKYFDSLYVKQPFAAGFSGKNCKYYVLQVMTDSVRYVYNTETSKDQLYQTIIRFGYDTVLLKKLALIMKELKCLWLAKSPVYFDEQPEPVTFFSFQSVLIDKPFTENKYYLLVFTDREITHPLVKAGLMRGEIIKLDERVYFTIGNRYR